MQWLRLANYRTTTGKRFPETMEAPVHVDIIDNNHPARPPTPDPSQSEHCVRCIGCNERKDQSRRAENVCRVSVACLRTKDVGPSTLKSAINGYANLAHPFTLYWRPIDTPEMTAAISFKRLKNET